MPRQVEIALGAKIIVWIYTFSAFFGLIFFWYFFPFILRKIGEKLLRHKCKKHRLIALTFDDGPSATLTNKLLLLLEEYDTKATFFVFGAKVELDDGIVKRLVQSGHELGCHSCKHLNAWKCSPWAVYSDISKGINQIVRYGGGRHFRPPYGKITLASMIQIFWNRFRLAWWTVDSTDTWEVSIDQEKILDKVRREGGGVVLLHDHARPQNPEREDFVLSVTRCLLEMAKNEGFRVCTMRDLRTISYF